MLKDQVIPFDNRRNLFIGKDIESAIQFATEHWIHSAKQAIQQRGKFVVALSGGSTPKVIYESLVTVKDLDWSKVFLFWSDERAVPPGDPDSNYGMAMKSFGNLPIPPYQIFRMKAEENIAENALDYEEKIRHHIGKHGFDLVMLGLGEDGHTASLFPNTDALSIEDRWVVPNYVPLKKTWRMTFTYPCINSSAKIAIYALGSSKEKIIPEVLKSPIRSQYPTSNIGTAEHPALWILDTASAASITV